MALCRFQPLEDQLLGVGPRDLDPPCTGQRRIAISAPQDNEFKRTLISGRVSRKTEARRSP